MRNDWWVPLTGVAFVVVLIVGFVIGGEPPDSGEPVQEIVEHYVDNETSVIIGAVLATIAGALLIFFAGNLRKVLRAAEGEGGALSALVLVGAAVIAVGAALDGTISFALADKADEIEPTAVQALQALWDNDFLPIALGILVFELSAGLSIVRHGALPRWLGWVAIVIAVVTVTPVGWFGFIAGGIWVLIVSVVLTLRGRTASV
jgi:Domain of unknown function (DUF4386)